MKNDASVSEYFEMEKRLIIIHIRFLR